MLRFSIILLFFICCSYTTMAVPRQLSFYKFQIDNDLSHNTAWCTLQDSYGFIWIGTSEGLNRFDGKHYKIFTHSAGDNNSLGNNCILSLYESDDRKLWIGTELDLYIYDLVSEEFQRFDTKTEDEVIISTGVSKIIGGDQDKIWIGTLGQGYFIYDRQTKVLRQNTRYSSYIWALHKNPAGNMFFNTDEGDIVELNRAGNYLNTYKSPGLSNNLRNIKVTSIYYKDGILWYGLDIFGLVRLDLQTKEMRMLTPVGNTSTSYIHSIQPYTDREFLVGAENGLYLFDIQSGKYESVSGNDIAGSPNDQFINDIYTDREGGIWFSTKYGGVNYLAKTSTPFNHYHPVYQQDVKIGKIIRSFYEDSKGNIWITSEDEGVTIYNPHNNTFTPFHTVSGHINTILIDNDKVWMGTEAQGIDIYDIKTGETTNYKFQSGNPRTISDNSVKVIYKTSYGDIFIGTVWGINIYNKETKDFSSISQIAQVGNLASVSDIKEDSRGYVWFTTSNAGVFRYNPANKEWAGFGHNRTDPNSLPINKITTVYEDSRQRIWFGTEGAGLCRYDYDKNIFIKFDPDSKILPGQIIYRMEEDGNNNFWISSNSGLICLNPDSKEVLGHFTKEDGLQSNQFNLRSSLKAADGRMYFGGINGFNAFYPKDIEYNAPLSNMRITNLYLYGEEVYANKQGSPLSKSIFETDRLELKHNQNSISFDFADLSYKSLSKKQYAYMLEGLENRWTNVGSGRSVFFNNIPPGEYILKIKAIDGNKRRIESETSMKIHVLPPFYKTTSAYVIYFLLFILSAYLFLVWWTKRLRRKNEVLMREEQIKREKELYTSKIEFFTNLVHEIRTPLSLIKVPLDYIIKSQDGNNDTKSYLKTIDRNTNRLLNLVNQLLDFRKVEESKFELNLQQYDIISLVEDVCNRFIPVAQIRNIEFIKQYDPVRLTARVDVEAITKIISNMLSNALKYTHSKIEVSVADYESYFEICVTDDGEGVPESEREKIFKTFYQADKSRSGTGIGLPLAHLLAEKHNGKFFLKKTTSKGASFVVAIPFLQEEVMSDGTALPELTVMSGRNEYNTSGHLQMLGVSDYKPNLLLVEDNEELLNMTASFLEKIYTVYKASNGKDAIAIIEEENINIIVSDFMMPEMDGYELCEFVKNDTRYCHIPIIILTAKTDLNTKLKSLEIGADAYIEKPYLLEHLLVQVSNLLENRRKLIELYSSTAGLPQAFEINIQKRDKEFIDKLNAEIENHIQDTDFCIDSLAQQMCMSRSNFYRKIKGLFNIPPNEYLKIYRLRKAVTLLQQGEYRIREIYLLVGFSSPSYFTKCFKDQYGVTPKEYVTTK